MSVLLEFTPRTQLQATFYDSSPPSGAGTRTGTACSETAKAYALRRPHRMMSDKAAAAGAFVDCVHQIQTRCGALAMQTTTAPVPTSRRAAATPTAATHGHDFSTQVAVQYRLQLVNDESRRMHSLCSQLFPKMPASMARTTTMMMSSLLHTHSTCMACCTLRVDHSTPPALDRRRRVPQRYNTRQAQRRGFMAVSRAWLVLEYSVHRDRPVQDGSTEDQKRWLYLRPKRRAAHCGASQLRQRTHHNHGLYCRTVEFVRKCVLRCTQHGGGPNPYTVKHGVRFASVLLAVAACDTGMGLSCHWHR